MKPKKASTSKKKSSLIATIPLTKNTSFALTSTSLKLLSLIWIAVWLFVIGFNEEIVAISYLKYVLIIIGAMGYAYASVKNYRGSNVYVKLIIFLLTAAVICVLSDFAFAAAVVLAGLIQSN
jgi:hypothetical protein